MPDVGTNANDDGTARLCPHDPFVARRVQETLNNAHLQLMELGLQNEEDLEYFTDVLAKLEDAMRVAGIDLDSEED